MKSGPVRCRLTPGDTYQKHEEPTLENIQQKKKQARSSFRCCSKKRQKTFQCRLLGLRCSIHRISSSSCQNETALIIRPRDPVTCDKAGRRANFQLMSSAACPKQREAASQSESIHFSSGSQSRGLPVPYGRIINCRPLGWSVIRTKVRRYHCGYEGLLLIHLCQEISDAVEMFQPTEQSERK